MGISLSQLAFSLCLFAILQFSNVNAEFRLYKPGRFSSPSNNLGVLKNGDSICLKKHPSGINIQCVAKESDKMAVFRIDGKLIKKETYAPYFIGGDKNGMIRKWTSFPKGSFVLECALRSETTRIRLTISESCSSSPERPARSSAPKPSKRPFQPSRPGPVRSPKAPKKPSGMPGDKAKIGCVIVGTQGVKLSKGWVRQNNGIAYLPHSSSTKLTPKGDAPVYFNFKAKKTGRHAFVVDLTTRANSEHNDIWIWMEKGFQLIKEGRPPKHETGWIKGFQKLSSRGVALVSGDHDPYSIATAEILQAGKTYRFGIAGRSTKVTIHRTLLYVCKGLECTRWKGRHLQETCIPGSFPSRRK